MQEVSRTKVALQVAVQDTAAIEHHAGGKRYGTEIRRFSAVEGILRRLSAAQAAGLSFEETNELITAASSRMAQMGLNANSRSRRCKLTRLWVKPVRRT